jgi:hypothetical protein
VRVCVYLFCELLLTQFVQSVELLGEDDVLDESTRGQLDSDDDGAVGNHHGDCAEVDLQILGKLLTNGILHTNT